MQGSSPQTDAGVLANWRRGLRFITTGSIGEMSLIIAKVKVDRDLGFVVELRQVHNNIQDRRVVEAGCLTQCASRASEGCSSMLYGRIDCMSNFEATE